jgi:hypothetical protein
MPSYKNPGVPGLVRIGRVPLLLSTFTVLQDVRVFTPNSATRCFQRFGESSQEGSSEEERSHAQYLSSKQRA